MSHITKSDLLKLYEKGKFEEIQAILDSDEHTKQEKVTMIYDEQSDCFFSAICFPKRYIEENYRAIPLQLSMKVLRILGETLSTEPIIAKLKYLLAQAEEIEMKDTLCLLRVVLEELNHSKFSKVISSLILYALYYDLDIKILSVLLESKHGIFVKHGMVYSYSKSDGEIDDNETELCDFEYYKKRYCSYDDCHCISVFHEVTFLEMALIRNKCIEIVKLFIKCGGKDLLYLSKRSLLKGVIAEYDYYKSKVLEILKCLLEVGGIDLILNESDWLENYDTQGTNFFQFLSSEVFEIYAKDFCRKRISIDHIFEIMSMLIETGQKDLILAKNARGEFIFHGFKYFGRSKFSPIMRRILEIGGMDLLGMRDKNGDTILHCLARCEEDAIDYYRQILTFNEDLVMARNNTGKTALHIACKNSHSNFIELLIKKGGKELLWEQDTRGNTALHLLPLSDKQGISNFASFKSIVETAGSDILHTLNKRKEKPFPPFVMKAIEFQLDEKKLHATIEKLKKDSKVDKKEVCDLKKKLRCTQREKQNLQDVEQSLKSDNKELRGSIMRLQDERKQADLEFETVKTLHEENKNAYEKSLVEIKKLKEVEQSQQDDMRDQKELIQNLQNKLKQKDDKNEAYELRLHKLEEENQRLQDFHCNMEKDPDIRIASSIEDGNQRLIEEINAIDESSQTQRITELQREIQSLGDAINAQKQIAKEKQKENKLLKDENKTLNYKLKRSREDGEEIDCVEEEDEDGIYSPPSKRGKTATSSSESRASENARTRIESLEAEVEELIDQLEHEKANHSKTLKRLKEARRVSKNN